MPEEKVPQQGQKEETAAPLNTVQPQEKEAVRPLSQEEQKPGDPPASGPHKILNELDKEASRQSDEAKSNPPENKSEKILPVKEEISTGRTTESYTALISESMRRLDEVLKQFKEVG